MQFVSMINFSTVGQKIHENVRNSRSKSFKSFLRGNVCDSLFFSPITESEIIDVVLKLDVNKSAGYDGFNARIVEIFYPCNY